VVGAFRHPSSPSSLGLSIAHLPDLLGFSWIPWIRDEFVGVWFLVVAILSLILVVVIQQVQIGRRYAQIAVMGRLIDVSKKENATLAKIIREQRDHMERQKKR
jgi:hypothetical protein